MKKSLFFGLGVATLALGAAAFGVGSKATQAPIETRATGASGVMTIDCTGGDWATNPEGQKFSILFSDEGENEGWGNFVFSAQNVFLAEVSYELSFVPTKMKAYRYNPSKTAEEWAENKTSNVWNTSSELDFTANGNIIIGNWDKDHNTATVGYWAIAGQSAETTWTWTEPLDSFTGVKLNNSNHVEYFGVINFTQWKEFVAHDGDSYAKFGQTTFSSHVDVDEWTSHGDGNIQYTKKDEKSFAVYYDRNAATIYINDPAHAEADDWGDAFLGDNCEFTKVNWSALSASYGALGTGAKNLYLTEKADGDETGDLYQQAVARYDLVLKRYGIYNETTNPTGYVDFIGRAAKLSLAKSASSTMVSSSNNATIWAIVGITLGAATLLGVTFAFRKRRQD